MKIIDMHTHVFPDDIAEKTIGFLAERAQATPFLKGTVADLRRSMQEAGVTLSVNQPVSTKPSQVPAINDWALGFGTKGVISFGTIHPRFEGFREEIARIKRGGIKGVKLHPDYQRFSPDDESVFPLYESLMEHDMILLFHAGIDIGLYPPVYCTPKSLANLLDVFPKIKIVAAHLGGYECWADVERYLVGRDIFFDTAYVMDYIEQEMLIRIMRGHGLDRIIFATDSPWKPQKEEIDKILSLPLPEKEKEAILCRNASRLLDL